MRGGRRRGSRANLSGAHHSFSLQKGAESPGRPLRGEHSGRPSLLTSCRWRPGRQIGHCHCHCADTFLGGALFGRSTRGFVRESSPWPRNYGTRSRSEQSLSCAAAGGTANGWAAQLGGQSGPLRSAQQGSGLSRRYPGQFCHHPPEIAKRWATSGSLQPESCKSGRIRTKFGRVRAEFGRNPRELSKSGPTPAEVAQIRAKSGRSRASLAEAKRNFTETGTKSGQTRANLVKIGRLWANLEPTSAGFGPIWAQIGPNLAESGKFKIISHVNEALSQSWSWPPALPNVGSLPLFGTARVSFLGGDAAELAARCRSRCGRAAWSPRSATHPRYRSPRWCTCLTT